MANPDTCLHNVVDARITEELELDIGCVSCGTDMSAPNKRARKNYKYDPVHFVWVHVPARRTQRIAP